MAKQINFEVQVMQGGRWTIHARFPSTGREEAIEEAKQVGGLGAVRVLRDVYDGDAGTSDEFTIYKHDAKNSAIQGAGGGDSHGSSHDDDHGGSDDDWMRGGDDDDDEADGGSDDDWMRGDDDDDRPTRKKRKAKGKSDGVKSTSFTGLIIKLLFIILLSVGLAVTAVAVMSPYIEGMNLFGTTLTGVAKENALIMTFLVTFITTAIILSSVLLSNTSLKERRRKARARQSAKRQAMRRSPGAGNPASAAAAATDHSAQSTTPQSLPPIPSDTEGLPPIPQDAETAGLAPMAESEGMEQFREAAADGSFSLDISTGNEASDQNNQEDSGPKRGVVLGAEDFPMPGVKEEAILSPHAEKQKKYMMQFIDKALGAVGKDTKSMSNFDKFGVSLFLAGACETLGQKHELGEDDLAKIMADSVQTMGFKRSHAKTFAEKYDEYLVQDPTYMQMFQAGRNSLATYLTDESRIEKNMVSSMAEWNKPKVKESEAGPVTVLFTDIAGSTAMTQNLGDAGAQHVVRAHNRVVREALTMWNGKEVKHTGDGIMASFVKTSDSIDASMQMQRETAEYTEQNPDKPLHLKIGINAGEPISEDNDLFGSTVQMSARIVDKAQADEIFVSEIVRGICAGKSYKFVNRGTYPMKGFDTDPILYEVTWKE